MFLTALLFVIFLLPFLASLRASLLLTLQTPHRL
jgi:hypothetical protein